MLFVQLTEFSDLGLFLLRFGVAVIFLFHGLSKLDSWKVKLSPEDSSKMQYIMKTLSVVEPSAAVALFLGLYIQIAALILIVIMLGALYFKIMVWKNKFSGAGGWELDFLLLICNLTILLTAGGALGKLTDIWSP